MKKLFTLLLIAMSFISSAQCISSQIPCVSPITDTCPVNQSWNGDQCFQGIMAISNSNNWNNWTNLSFKGNITVGQVINMQTGTNVYSDGWNTFSHVNMHGNTDFFVSGQQTVISNIVANNGGPGQHNTIYLVNGATVIVENVQYYAGQFIQLPGNTSNRVYIEACTNTALPITIRSFELKKMELQWAVDLQNGEKVELQQAGHAAPNDFQTVYISGKAQDFFEATPGYYRIKVDMKVSATIHVQFGQQTSLPGVMRDIYTGQIISKPILFRPYIQDGKVKEVIQ